MAYLKSAILAGDGPRAAAYVRGQLAGACDSPTSCYAAAIAALLEGDDAAGGRGRRGDARPAARPSTGPPRRSPRWPPASRGRYRAAVEAIVADFEGRDAHVTGVPVADTAMLMEALADRRGIAARPRSPLIPQPAAR